MCSRETSNVPSAEYVRPIASRFIGMPQDNVRSSESEEASDAGGHGPDAGHRAGPGAAGPTTSMVGGAGSGGAPRDGGRSPRRPSGSRRRLSAAVGQPADLGDARDRRADDVDGVPHHTPRGPRTGPPRRRWRGAAPARRSGAARRPGEGVPRAGRAFGPAYDAP